MTPAAAALRQAGELGVLFKLEAGRVLCRHGDALPANVLRALREHQVEVREILAGYRCRHCGERISWLEPGGVPFADGRAAHLACYEAAELERPRAAGQRAGEPPNALTAREEARS